MLRSGAEIRRPGPRLPFRRTPLDWLVVVFLVTAWVGYWASYDKATAWSKAWVIVAAVFLFYLLASQPRERLSVSCIILFCVGVVISIYFFLTHDFVALPRRVELVNRIGRWLMEVRPKLGWTPLPPNHVAGLIAISIPFILYPASKLSKRRDNVSLFLSGLVVLGVGLALCAVLMTTSRGIIMAIAGASGIWILWWIVSFPGSKLWSGRKVIYPALVLVYLFALAAVLYAGPANLGYAASGQSDYGTGSRAELFGRSTYLVRDFPFTGGGLGAFPGLYSYYILGIPFFYVVNSHNLFLDVAIEQGVLGGLAFLSIFLISIWFAARAIAEANSADYRLFAWLTLFVLLIAFIHGLVDDYLYLGLGTSLCLVLPALSMTMRPLPEPAIASKNLRIRNSVGLLLLALIGLLMMNSGMARSAWYADLGAVQMARVELAGFPTGRWTEPSVLPNLELAKDTLGSALEAGPTNPTANYRLGLIAVLRRDFSSAAANLEVAHQIAPRHRGIIKNLGYVYVWLGAFDQAQSLLDRIPEAESELKVYVWWWQSQGRFDLAENASIMASRLSAAP
jgi:tetratricopeptide (TPR) repeat protein